MKGKKRFTTVLLVIVFFVGLSVLLYPTISNAWNFRTQSNVIADYEAMMQNLPKADYSIQMEQVQHYNQRLAALNYPLVQYGEVSGYESLLNLDGTGVMGVLTIHRIGVKLPIYHTVEDAVLSVAVGHLPGSSLPVGGESTHAVLSAHRGLPSARLFTDLDLLEVGDTFQVEVLDQVLTYQVNQIRIVEPEDISLLAIEEGKDYCTLLTCTPYGVNTDRLLVRGVQVESAALQNIYIASDGYQIDTLIVAPIVAVPILIVLLLLVLLRPGKKNDEGEDFV